MLSHTCQWRVPALIVALAALTGTPASTVAHAADTADTPEQRSGKNIKLRKFEEVDQSDEYLRRAEEKRMQSIELLKQLLNSGVSDDEKAEMMLRLADLYFQQGRHLFLQEMSAFDVAYEACFDADPDLNPCNPDLIKPDNTASNDWQAKSIKLYQGILKNFPRYARADQALFYMGSAQKDLGQQVPASNAFKKLVKLYPDSGFVADAYIQIGEYYFDVKGEAFGAYKAFKRATQYPDNARIGYARYKLAWSAFNLGEYDEAIGEMKRVVNMAAAPDSAKNALQLRDEALRDLVRFYADADQVDQAIAYFTELGRPDLIRTTLKGMAALLSEQGKYERSVDMYRRLINDDPTSEDNPEFQGEIIAAYKKLGQRPKVLEEINRLQTDYGKDTAWARANASDPTAVANAQEKIEKNLRGIAVDYHTTARKYEKSRHPEADELYRLARAAYGSYLDLFPSNSHTYDVRYAYGELLYKLKEFEGAFDQYMAVVDLDPKGKHSRFCAESAIFAAEEQIKLEGGGDASGKVTAKASSDIEPQSLTAWEQRFVDACHKYANLYPEDKRVKDVIYKSAFLLYNKYRFDEAADQFEAVIAMDPRSREAEYAASLILDALNVRKNWTALNSTAKAFYDQEGLGSKNFKSETYKVYRNSSFKLVEVGFEKDKDHAKAADGFVAFYEEFPDADISPQALNNAAAYYAEAGRVADSVRVRHILVDDERFEGKTKYYYDQVGFLGYDYEQIFDLAAASRYYERFWDLFEDEKDKPENKEKLEELTQRAGDALYSAAVFRTALDEWEHGIALYREFVAAFPDDERIPEILLSIGNTYVAHERWQEAHDQFSAFYKKPPKQATTEHAYFARLHAGRALEAMGDMKKRDSLYAETVRLYKRDVGLEAGNQGAQTEFVAEMMYQLAQPDLDAYAALELRSLGPNAKRKAEDKHLGDSLANKAKTLQEVEAQFTEIVETGAGEWGLASLVALGKAYINMAHTLRTSDNPFYLTGEQVQFYRNDLDDYAFTQDEKAVNALDLALQKSFELPLYNENTAYAIRELGILRPAEFAGLFESIFDAGWTSADSTTSYDFETSL